MSEDREQHRGAMVAALGDEFVAACAAEDADESVACALGADDHLAAEQCLDQ